MSSKLRNARRHEVDVCALEDAVLDVRPLPELGEFAYLAIDEMTVDVLWFPAPTTYVEARVRSNARESGPPPSTAELEQMVLELSRLVDERLQPHLPLPPGEPA